MFGIPELENFTEHERPQQWIPSVAAEQDMKTFKFRKDSALFEHHFARDQSLYWKETPTYVFFL